MRPQHRPIIVLNAHYTGLGIARSLRGLPVDVIGVTAEMDTPARASRCLKLVESPDTEREPADAMEFLVRYAARLAVRPLLVPTRDHDVHFVMQYRERLASAFDLCMAPNEVLDSVLNKQRLFEIARSIGIDCPQSIEVTDSSEFDAAIAKLATPVVVKPVFSRDWRRPDVRRLVQRNKAFVMYDRDEIRRLYDALEPLAPRVLLQEFIAGSDQNLCVFGSYISASGAPRAYFTARKALQHPRVCGNGVAIRSGNTPPLLVGASLALLEALHYRGVSELEFKYDPGRQRLALIEMNARHWDQHRLSDAVGASVTLAMYEDWIGATEARRTASRDGTTILIEDAWLRGLADALRGREGNVIDFLRLLRLPMHGALWDTRDPGPFFHMLRDLAACRSRRPVALIKKPPEREEAS